MPWWLNNRTRMIQNNLRDIDARMDVDAFVETLLSFSANCVMVGAAGITAFYPTRLPFATKSPFLAERDLLGEIVEKCHAAGIRVIARFDFSKTHERLLPLHPDWYTKSRDGRFIHYNDTVHTCPSGEYQQSCSLATIREVIGQYPVDGIFFNMFGFTTSDYSGNQYGICHCDACKAAFRAFAGRELPQDGSDRDYAAFKEDTVTRLLARVRELTRSVNPEIAVCTYHHSSVDMIRSESNSAIDRPLPFWLMESAANVARVRGNWDGEKVSSNCVINATDIFYRFTGVSKELTRIRLYEEMAEGSGLDWCIIGDFADYPDRDSFEYVREVFRFHAENEAHFGHFISTSPVALLSPRVGRETDGFRGAFRMLKESHIPFRVVSPEEILARQGVMDGVALAIFPDGGMEDAWREVGRLGIGRLSLGDQPPMPARAVEKARSRYIALGDKRIFRSFPARDWITLDAGYAVPAGEWETAGKIVSPAMFGPPERCFGHEITGDAAVYIARAEKMVVVPFNAGGLYWRLGYEDHRNFVIDLIDAFFPEARLVRTNAPCQVELFFDRTREGETVLQLLNLSGQSGNTVTAHIPVQDVTIRIPGAFETARSLTGSRFSCRTEAGETVVEIPRLEIYEAIVLA